MEPHYKCITRSGNRPAAGAAVTVRKQSDGTLATIYSDDGVTVQANPITAGSDGCFKFFAADGKYDVTISGSGIVTKTYPVLLEDQVASYAAVDAKATAAQATADAAMPSTSLAAATGATLIGHGADTVASVLDALHLADYTELRAYAGSRKSVYVTGYQAAAAPSGIAGLFTRDDVDTTTADNGGTVIVAANGKRWKRRYDGAVNVHWFGAKGDGVTDDTAAFSAALAALSATGGGTLDARSSYKLTSALTIPSNVTLRGAGRYVSTLNFIGVSGLKSADGSQHVVIEGFYILGNDTAGTYGIEVENNPRGVQLRNLFIRRFGAAGNGAGVYLHNVTIFDHWNSTVDSVVVEDCGRGYVLANVQAVLLSNCIGRLNLGHSLYASGCVNLTVIGGTYENPVAATAPQYNIWIKDSAQVNLVGTWAENAITNNLRVENCKGVNVNGVLLNNISGGGNNNEIIGSSNVTFPGTRILSVEAGETGLAIDAASSDIDYSGLYGESIVGTLIADASTAGAAITLTNGFSIPSGSAAPSKPIYFVTSAGAVASDVGFAFLDGRDGFACTVINVGANSITIRNGANVVLSGAVDYVMGANDTLTVVYSAATGQWHETARSNN